MNFLEVVEQSIYNWTPKIENYYSLLSLNPKSLYSKPLEKEVLEYMTKQVASGTKPTLSSVEAIAKRYTSGAFAFGGKKQNINDNDILFHLTKEIQNIVNTEALSKIVDKSRTQPLTAEDIDGLWFGPDLSKSEYNKFNSDLDIYELIKESYSDIERTGTEIKLPDILFGEKIREGEINVILAPTSNGKSTLTNYIACFLNEVYNLNVLYVSPEMSEVSVAEVALNFQKATINSGVFKELNSFSNPKYENRLLGIFGGMLSPLKKNMGRFIPTTAKRISDIRRIADENDCKVIIIDNVYLLSSGNSNGTLSWQAIGENLNEISTFHDKYIFVTSQLDPKKNFTSVQNVEYSDISLATNITFIATKLFFVLSTVDSSQENVRNYQALLKKNRHGKLPNYASHFYLDFSDWTIKKHSL